MRYFQFAADDTGLAVYGYGQTIYAKLKFKFEFYDAGRIELVYLDSPPFQRFTGFVPTDANRNNNLAYSLNDDEQVITEDVTGIDYRFKWRLEFDCSPYPKGLKFPYDVPLAYYGYREIVNAKDAK